MVSGQHGYDQYVTGGVPWEDYTLEQLIKMVEDQASAPQLEQLATDWRSMGDQVVAASELLSIALSQLMEFWAGSAAEQAREDVDLNARWVGDLGHTAHEIGPSIDEAANALSAVQAAMPELPTAPAVQPALAPDSALRGYQSGGPLVAAINGTAAGTESAFGAEQEHNALKARAVEAMRRFEGAVISIDEKIPQFSERRDGEHLNPGEPVPTPTPPPGTTPPTPYPTDPEKRWDDLTKADPSTAAQGVGETGYSGGGGYSGGAAPLSADASRPPLQSGGAVGATEAVTGTNARPALTGAGAPVAAAAGAGATGMGGMPMGGAGAGGGQEAGGEHRRRYPYDGEDPFLLDQKASPPVIGL
ncbi:hypothetical protein JOD54_002286 [Actinokineospora baliensis]|uniref:hypothetical protein n=1 Tax=Actinokineospora baliensis TaxID=547056 RepID=UPI00195CD69B|nr:hypothetical protein [Actinokineospora baliensis]MBM7772082.1 hypothetical protein [Actinokineospora baliensis]